MLFYESDRIVRKNKKYEKTKAYAMVSKLENKGLSRTEQLEAVDILLKDNNTESQKSILELAKSLIEADIQENYDDKLSDENLASSNNNVSLYCLLPGEKI